MGRHRAPDGGEGWSNRIWTYCKPWYKRYRKFIIAAANAAMIALFAVWGDGITADELKFIVVSSLAALGVCAVPNAPGKKVKAK